MDVVNTSRMLARGKGADGVNQSDKAVQGTSASAPQQGDPGLISRERFYHLWSHLPSLTVLAALPGWGKSTWMDQCADFLAQQQPSVAVQRVYGRSAAEAALNAAPAAPDSLLIIDDAATSHSDPLWSGIRQYLSQNPGVRVLVSSIDHPDAALLGAETEVLILDERELRFTEEEDKAVLGRVSTIVPIPDLNAIPHSLKGVPALVGMRARSIVQGGVGGIWTAPDSWASVDLPERLAAWRPPAGADEPLILRMLRDGRDVRVVTASTLDRGEGDAAQVAATLERFEAIPFFHAVRDPETGEHGYAWLPHVWSHLDSLETASEHASRMERGLRNVQQSGAVASQLYYMLRRGELAQAERLTRSRYRRFLLFTDAQSTDLLLVLTDEVLESYPTLALLTGELLRRQSGDNERSKKLAATALRALRKTSGDNLESEVTRTCLMIYAAVCAGQRSAAHRFLHHLDEVLAGAEVQSRLPLSAECAEDLYMAFHGATQVDRHEDALSLARLIVEFSDPNHPLSHIDAVGLRTEEDLAGLTTQEDIAESRSLDGDLGQADRVSHAQPLLHMEDGLDDKAVSYLRRVTHESSRSALDGLKLATWALCAPELLSDESRKIVAQSRALWDDQQPSSFVALGAMLAYVATDDHEAAKELSKLLTGCDPFSLLAKIVWMQYQGEAAESVPLALHLAESNAPRLRVLARALAARGLAEDGRVAEGTAELERLWVVLPSPRLLRFALRLMPLPILDQIIEQSPGLTPSLREVLVSSKQDRRTLAWSGGVRLTKAEKEILLLMRQGLTNPQIADKRFVTAGTLRPQIRGMYRKLGVSSREEALQLTKNWPLGT